MHVGGVKIGYFRRICHYISVKVQYTDVMIIFYQNLRSRFGIERQPYTKSRIGQIPCVCMYVSVCVCKYSSQFPKPLNRFA